MGEPENTPTRFLRCPTCETERPFADFEKNGRRLKSCRLCRTNWAKKQAAKANPELALEEAKKQWSWGDDKIKDSKSRNKWRRESVSRAGRRTSR